MSSNNGILRTGPPLRGRRPYDTDEDDVDDTTDNHNLAGGDVEQPNDHFLEDSADLDDIVAMDEDDLPPPEESPRPVMGRSRVSFKGNGSSGGNNNHYPSNSGMMIDQLPMNGHGSNNSNQYDDDMYLPSFWCIICCVIAGVLLGSAGTALGIYNTIDASGHDHGDLGIKNDGTTAVDPVSRLEAIVDRGYLVCGTGAAGTPGFLLETSKGNYAGMEWDLCLALASAIFNGELVNEQGEPRYQVVPDVSTLSANTSSTEVVVDVLFRSTPTLERDVLEPLTFSTPYFWSGLRFGGLPSTLACAEAMDFNSSTVCAETKICVVNGTTHQAILETELMVPQENLVVVESDDFPRAFQLSTCNVLAGDGAYINRNAVQQSGYSGPYEMGTKVFSKEPQSMVTLQGDARFSDFVEWVLQALVYAEEEGISKANAFRLEPTTIFDKNVTNDQGKVVVYTYTNMFEKAVGYRGNLGEIYNINLESFFPRDGLNGINQGDSPIQYSPPFGDTSLVGPQLELTSKTVAAIKERGFLNCGINLRTGFAEFDQDTQTWSGFDVDLCRGIAAALFDGVPQVVFTDLPAAQRFQVLADKRVDLLARLTTLTLSRDVKEPATGEGLSFATPYFYDGLTFGGLPEFVQCADNLDVISPTCQNLHICLLQGTTMFSRVQNLFRDDYVTAKLTFQEVIEGLNDGSCNAIAGGFNDVAVQTIRERGYAGNYSIGSRRFSKDPLALTTRQDDPLWSKFVKWVFFGLVYAEEKGIARTNAAEMPRTKLFGPLRSNAFYHAVNAIGNYGEVYNRNFGSLIPRKGMHLLNSQNGPMLYAFPGIDIN